MEQIASLVDELYGTIGDRGFDAFPELIARICGARSCAFQVLTPDFTPLVVKTSYFTSEMNQFYVEHGIFQDDVWQKAMGFARSQRAENLLQRVSHEAYSRSRFYTDFIKAFGDDTAQCVGLVIPSMSGEMISVGAHRALRAKQFEQPSVDALTQIAPHLRRIVSAQMRVASFKTATTTWEAALEAMPNAALIVSHKGTVKFANKRARIILRRNDGLSLSDNQLQINDAHKKALYQQYVFEALMRRSSRGGALLVPREGALRPYSLVIQPFDSDERTHALVLIGDSDEQRVEKPDILRQLYGLTPAETEVSLLVADGLTIEEVADRRQVTVATAKTLLQRAYQKIDVSKATELARVVATLPI